MTLRPLLFLSAMAVAFGCKPSARAVEPPPEKTLAVLADHIRRELPRGWAVEEEPANGALVISREKKVMASFSAPSLFVDLRPQKTTFSFCFRLAPLVTGEEFRRRYEENQTTRRELGHLYRQILREGGSGKGDSLTLPPATAKGRELVSRYRAAQLSLHRLPDFHFADASVWSIHPDSPTVEDTAVRAECDAVRARVEGLLGKYDLP